MALAPLQPSGATSYAGDSAHRMLEAVHTLQVWLRSLGAQPVLSSSLVSYRQASDWLSMADEQRIRFIDRRSGDVVSLRADHTAQILRHATPGTEGTWFAVGPVYREDAELLGNVREAWQASCEFLYGDPDASLQRMFLAVCSFVDAVLGPEATMVLSGPFLEEKPSTTLGRYEIPASGVAYRRLSEQGALPGCLDQAVAAGVLPGNLVMDSVLAPQRDYYRGWHFRVFIPDAVHPVLQGGQYADPVQEDTLHAGFGIWLEPLALGDYSMASLPGIPATNTKTGKEG